MPAVIHVRHDIGLVTTTGLYGTYAIPGITPTLAEGTTAASVIRTAGGNLQADIHVAERMTSTIESSSAAASQDESVSLIHNPMMAFWKRAKLYFDDRHAAVEKGFPLMFDDVALVISDLGQSISMLFGRQWNTIKEPYEASIGTPPTRTPDVLFLVDTCFPLKGWNMKAEVPILHRHLVRFIEVYYKDLIKHFEYDKFLKGLEITFEDVKSFMELTRQSWLWLVQKLFGKPYSDSDPDYSEFRTEYAKLT